MPVVPIKKKEKASLWSFKKISFLEAGKRSYECFNNHDVLGNSAKLAYYALLSIFPLAIAVLGITGLIAHGNPHFRDALYSSLTRFAPSDAGSLVTRTITETTHGSSGWKLVLGILGAIWAASSGMSALGDTLNAMYDVKESRGFIKARAIYVALTAGLTVMIVIALAIFLFGGRIADFASRHIGLGSAGNFAWKVVQWPLAIGLIVAAFALVYYFAPDVWDAKWQWITPGAVLGVLLWIVASVGFKIYLSYFNSYSKMYGSLGAVIILMLWFYISGIAVLSGAVINSTLEHMAAEQGDPTAKDQGEKAAPAA